MIYAEIEFLKETFIEFIPHETKASKFMQYFDSSEKLPCMLDKGKEGYIIHISCGNPYEKLFLAKIAFDVVIVKEIK